MIVHDLVFTCATPSSLISTSAIASLRTALFAGTVTLIGAPFFPSSLLIQLRTGKVGLAKFLSKRKVPGFPNHRCRCGGGIGHPKHLLLDCTIHSVARREVFRGRLRDPFVGGSARDPSLDEKGSAVGDGNS